MDQGGVLGPRSQIWDNSIFQGPFVVELILEGLATESRWLMVRARGEEVKVCGGWRWGMVG